MTQRNSQPQDRILVKPLASLRFLLAMTVLLNHLNVLPGITTGRMALATFFVISGFFHELHHSVKKVEWCASWRFQSRSLARFFLMQWVCLGAWVAFSTAQVDWTIACHITLTQCWVPQDLVCMGYNGASWFLSTLLFSYMLFPLLSSITQSITARVKWPVIIVALCLATCVKYNSETNYYWQFFPPIRVIDFTYGIMLAQATRWLLGHPVSASLSRFLPWLELLGVVAVAVVASVVDGNSSTWATWLILPLILPVFTMAAVLNDRGPIHRLMSLKWLHRARAISFEIYMLHLLVMATLKLTLDALGITVSQWQWVLLAITASIIVAAIAHSAMMMFINRIATALKETQKHNLT